MPASNPSPGAGGRVHPDWADGAGKGSVLLPESQAPAVPLPAHPRPGTPGPPPSPPWPPAPSHSGRARRALPKFPKGAESCGPAVGGRLPRAPSAGSSARQSRGARSGGMPARRLPAAPGGGLLRRAGGAHTHTRAPGNPTSGSPLLPSPSWLAGGAVLSWPLGPGSTPRLVPRLRRTRTPRPCAPSRGRGTSEAQGGCTLRPRTPAPPPGPRPRRSLRTPRPLSGRAPPRAPTSLALPRAGARVRSLGPPELGATAVRGLRGRP